MPPDSAVRVSRRPASSGTFCMARTRWSRSSPRNSWSGVESSDPTQQTPATNLADDRLTGRHVGRNVVLTAALGDEVVDRAEDDDRTDRGLEDRPRWQPIKERAADLEEGVDEWIRPGIPEVVAKGAE